MLVVLLLYFFCGPETSKLINLGQVHNTVTEHEMSGEHRKRMLSLIHRTKHLGTVDASLERQTDAESQYWKDILRRVIDIIKCLSERGLPLSEIFTS